MKREKLTLSEDNVVALNKLVKVVLLQLYDIGSGSSCRGCEQTESDALGVHCDCDSKTGQQRWTVRVRLRVWTASVMVATQLTKFNCRFQRQAGGTPWQLTFGIFLGSLESWKR